MYINNRMLLFYGDENKQTVYQNLKKLTWNQVFRLLMEMRNYTQCWVKSMHHKIHDRWKERLIMVSSLSLVSCWEVWYICFYLCRHKLLSSSLISVIFIYIKLIYIFIIMNWILMIILYFTFIQFIIINM